MKEFVVGNNSYWLRQSGVTDKNREWWYVLDKKRLLYLYRCDNKWWHGGMGYCSHEKSYFTSRRHAIQVLKQVEGKNIKIIGDK